MKLMRALPQRILVQQAVSIKSQVYEAAVLQSSTFDMEAEYTCCAVYDAIQLRLYCLHWFEIMVIFS